MTETPDFDNMTPEQIMSWMETLAKRQGAGEGFTTSADMDVPEVDASTVDASILAQEYIPYGWKKEDWYAHLEKEKAQKASQAQAKASVPLVIPEPVVVPEPEPEPIVQAVAAAPADDGTPDFDSMTPEQIMAWMEKLAVRQGADTNTMVSSASDRDKIQANEIDASTVDASVLAQEYIPYGWKKEDWYAHLEKEKAQKASQAQAQKPAPVPVSYDEPVAEDDYEEEYEDEAEEFGDFDVLAAPSFDDIFGQSDSDEDELEAFGTEEEEDTIAAANPMDWLANLSSETDDEVSFSGFGNDLTSLQGAPVASNDPLDWLAGLATVDDAPTLDLSSAMGDLSSLGSFSAQATDTNTGSDPLAWLETLSVQEGVDSEELMTDADESIFPPAELTNEGPGYQPYSFEDAVAPTDPLQVMETLNSGKEVPPEAIANFFEEMFKRAEQTDDEPADEDFVALDAPAIETEIPDWLREGMTQETADEDMLAQGVNTEQMLADLGFGVDMTDAEENIGDFDLILDADDAPPIANEIPSWLLDIDDEEETRDMSDIFVDEEPVVAQGEVQRIDLTDPWVMALTTEAENQQELQAWYQRQVIEGNAGETIGALTTEELPLEADLPIGEPQDVPSWMMGDVPDAEQYVMETPQIEVSEFPDWLQDTPASVTMPDWLNVDESASPASDLPEWLAGADVDISSDEIPEWLRETMEEEKPVEPAMPILTEPTPAPVQRAAAVAVPVSTPPAARPKIDVAAALKTAREQLSVNIETSLQSYEAVVRANVSLPEVVGDLNKLLVDKNHKNNPAVYRVLGDALMRQGNLQEALNTYRRALNLL